MHDAVLLDVDGTLVDSNLLHVLAWSRAFRRIGRSIEAGAVLHAIGMGADRLVPLLLGNVDAATADAARALHAEEYVAKRLVEHAEVLAGAVELLQTLRARGFSTALASSAKREEVDRYLPALGAADTVDAVVTGQDVPTTKPCPHIFAVALERLGDPARALVVGDTVYDVEAAGKLGLLCVCVLTGGIERDALLTAGAAAVYDGPGDLARDLDAASSFMRCVPRVGSQA